MTNRFTPKLLLCSLASASVIGAVLLVGCKKDAQEESGESGSTPPAVAPGTFGEWLNSHEGIESAWKIVQDEAKKRLKSPATAAFPESHLLHGFSEDMNDPTVLMSYSLFRSNRKTSTERKDVSYGIRWIGGNYGLNWFPVNGAFVVVAYLDSQNSYGALVRSELAAIVYPKFSSVPSGSTSRSDWEVVEFEIIPN